jgi:hypothetical protein
MFAPRLAAGLLAVGLLTGLVLAQDAKQDDTTTKARGQLPPNWKRLGLDDEQVQSIYKIQTKYKNRIDALVQQMTSLKKEMDAEQLKVLTPAQRARLREILSGKTIDPETPAPKKGDNIKPGDSAKKDDKSSPDKPKP